MSASLEIDNVQPWIREPYIDVELEEPMPFFRKGLAGRDLEGITLETLPADALVSGIQATVTYREGQISHYGIRLQLRGNDQLAQEASFGVGDIVESASMYDPFANERAVNLLLHYPSLSGISVADVRDAQIAASRWAQDEMDEEVRGDVQLLVGMAFEPIMESPAVDSTLAMIESVAERTGYVPSWAIWDEVESGRMDLQQLTPATGAIVTGDVKAERYLDQKTNRELEF